MTIKRKHKYGIASKQNRTWKGIWRGREQTIVFHSKKEMNRFCELLILVKANLISELSIQESFLLQEAFGDEREIKYFADFMYLEKGEWVVEDVKGLKTDMYIQKRKLFKYKFRNIIFTEL